MESAARSPADAAANWTERLQQENQKGLRLRNATYLISEKHINAWFESDPGFICF
jgi:hypothetical protein